MGSSFWQSQKQCEKRDLESTRQEHKPKAVYQKTETEDVIQADFTATTAVPKALSAQRAAHSTAQPYQSGTHAEGLERTNMCWAPGMSRELGVVRGNWVQWKRE